MFELFFVNKDNEYIAEATGGVALASIAIALLISVIQSKVNAKYKFKVHHIPKKEAEEKYNLPDKEEIDSINADIKKANAVVKKVFNKVASDKLKKSTTISDKTEERFSEITNAKFKKAAYWVLGATFKIDRNKFVYHEYLDDEIDNFIYDCNVALKDLDLNHTTIRLNEASFTDSGDIDSDYRYVAIMYTVYIDEKVKTESGYYDWQSGGNIDRGFYDSISKSDAERHFVIPTDNEHAEMIKELKSAVDASVKVIKSNIPADQMKYVSINTKISEDYEMHVYKKETCELHIVGLQSSVTNKNALYKIQRKTQQGAYVNIGNPIAFIRSEINTAIKNLDLKYNIRCKGSDIVLTYKCKRKK